MGALRQWLLGVVLTAFAASLAGELAPGGRERGAVRLVGGLLVLLALLRPLAGLGGTAVPAMKADLSGQTQAQAERYRREGRETLSAIIEQRTASYILDKACGLGLECGVEVTVSAGESGVPLPSGVTITGGYSAALAALIEEGVGIPADKQIWLEEDTWSGTEESG